MPAQGGKLPSRIEHPPDLAVVGGGIAGLAVAQRACARGLRPLVLDRGRPGAATTAVAAGMLAPVAEAAFGERALLELGLDAARRYGDWVGELADASGLDPGYRATGTLLVARDRDQAEALEREAAFRRENGLTVERLRASQARALEPSLAPTIRLGLEIADDHAVDPVALAAALVAAIERGGGTVLAGVDVQAVEVKRERVRGVRIADAAAGGRSGDLVAAEHVVVAAGAWSGALAGVAPDARVPIRPVKGQLLRLRDPAGGGLLERVLRTEEAYVVPRGDGRHVVGATREERGFDTTVTARAVYELLRDAGAVLPGLLELEVESTAAGLRPATPDNAPALGPGAIEGLHWATGHYRHGILLAPVTGEAVVAGVLAEPVPPLAEPFSPLRFAAAGARPREAVA
jgi:glycine oxidase